MVVVVVVVVVQSVNELEYTHLQTGTYTFHNFVAHYLKFWVDRNFGTIYRPVRLYSTVVSARNVLRHVDVTRKLTKDCYASTATTITRTRYNAALYVQYIACFVLLLADGNNLADEDSYLLRCHPISSVFQRANKFGSDESSSNHWGRRQNVRLKSMYLFPLFSLLVGWVGWWLTVRPHRFNPEEGTHWMRGFVGSINRLDILQIREASYLYRESN